MTLPVSFPLSMSQIATELGISLPLSLNHAWVLALAQKAGLPLSFSDLLGKTGRFDGNVAISTVGPGDIGGTLNTPFFGGTIAVITRHTNTGGAVEVIAAASPNPSWTGNVLLKNNTTGASMVLPYVAGSPVEWAAGDTTSGQIIRNGVTDSFTILPST